MAEFKTYLFRENEVSTHNARVKKERFYIIGVLVGLVGIVFHLLELPYANYFAVAGFIAILLGRVLSSGKDPSIGHRPTSLTLRESSILLGAEEIKITDRREVRIFIAGYAGQSSFHGTYNTNSGNDNFIHFPYKGRMVALQFVLESESHKQQLTQFCEEYGFEH